MSCQCFQIGGPFIAEDPDCPAHGREAQRLAAEAEGRHDEVIAQLEEALRDGDELYDAVSYAISYLRSL